jgi:hypothetical protein
MSYLNIDSVDFSELKFPRPKGSSGSRFISIFYNKKAFGLKLPKLRIPFNSQLNQYNQLAFNLSLGTDEDLICKFKQLDEQIVKFAEDLGWGTEGLEYAPTLRESRNNDFPPTIGIKIPREDNTIKTIFFDKNKSRINVNTSDEVLKILSKGTSVLSAIKCGGVWFNDKRYGLSWKAEQVRVVELPMTQKINEEYAFVEDSSDLDSLSDTELLVDDV